MPPSWQTESVDPRVRPNRQESDHGPLLKPACWVASDRVVMSINHQGQERKYVFYWVGLIKLTLQHQGEGPVRRNVWFSSRHLNLTCWNELWDLFLSTGNHHHEYQHSHLDLTALTPKLGKNTKTTRSPTATNKHSLTALCRFVKIKLLCSFFFFFLIWLLNKNNWPDFDFSHKRSASLPVCKWNQTKTILATDRFQFQGQKVYLLPGKLKNPRSR